MFLCAYPNNLFLSIACLYPTKRKPDVVFVASLDRSTCIVDVDSHVAARFRKEWVAINDKTLFYTKQIIRLLNIAIISEATSSICANNLRQKFRKETARSFKIPHRRKSLARHARSIPFHRIAQTIPLNFLSVFHFVEFPRRWQNSFGSEKNCCLKLFTQSNANATQVLLVHLVPRK